jgi:hypothetical protein
VFVSTEVIAIIVSTLTLLMTLGGGMFAFGRWMVTRMDAQDNVLRGEVGGLRTEMRDEFAAVRTEMRDEFALVRADIKDLGSRVGGLEVAVARLEGPQPRLVYSAR